MFTNFKKVTIVCNKYKSKFSKQMEYKLYGLLSPQWPNLKNIYLNMLVSKVTFCFMSKTKRWYVCIAVVLYKFYSHCFEFGIEVNNKWLFFGVQPQYLVTCLFHYLPFSTLVFWGPVKQNRKIHVMYIFFWSKTCFNKVM